MAIDPKIIKHKEVLIDQAAGTATVNITIYPRSLDKIRSKIYTNHVIPLVIEAGAEVVEIIEGCEINNRYGEASGTWIFKITSTIKKPLVKKAKSIEPKKEAAAKKEAPVKVEPKKEEPSSGFFAKRDKKKGNK